MKKSNIVGSISGLIFTLTGCVLLVIKLATAATFSWWWVWGIMFAYGWISLGILGCILAVVLAVALIALVVAIPCGCIWAGYHFIIDQPFIPLALADGMNGG